MFELFFRLKKFIPTMCAKTVYDIDYIKLYEQGKRIILTDLDNTLLPYDLQYANDELKQLINKIRSIGFEIIVVSNNHKKRVKNFSNDINCPYISFAMKPLTSGYRKALRKFKLKKEKQEVIAIGDQLLTDILGASRVKIDTILVKPIKQKTEKWYTRLNRRKEQNILKKLKKHYPEKYLEIEAIQS